MDYVIWFVVGVVVGVAITIAVILATMHYLGKLIDEDEDLRRINGR